MIEPIHQVAYDQGIDAIEHAVSVVEIQVGARDTIRDARMHSPTAYPVFKCSLSSDATARRIVADLLNAGWTPPAVNRTADPRQTNG